MAGAAVVLTGQMEHMGIGSTRQRATWVKLALDAPDPAPQIKLRYGPADDQAIFMQWQPYPESIVAVRPLNNKLGPPREIHQLALELPTSDGTYFIRQLEVLSDPPQIWSASAGIGGWTAAGCVLGAQAAGLALTTAAQSPCVVQIADLRTLNPPQIGRWLLVVGVLLALLALLWVLTLLAGLAQPVLVQFRVTENRAGRWLHEQTQGWHLGAWHAGGALYCGG
jgi:hypothetical protein